MAFSKPHCLFAVQLDSRVRYRDCTILAADIVGSFVGCVVCKCAQSMCVCARVRAVCAYSWSTHCMYTRTDAFGVAVSTYVSNVVFCWLSRRQTTFVLKSAHLKKALCSFSFASRLAMWKRILIRAWIKQCACMMAPPSKFTPRYTHGQYVNIVYCTIRRTQPLTPSPAPA